MQVSVILPIVISLASLGATILIDRKWRLLHSRNGKTRTLHNECTLMMRDSTSWSSEEWKDFTGGVEKRLFEADRNSHMRLQFSIAIHSAVLVGGAVVLAGSGKYVAPVALGISVFGLLLLFTSWSAIRNLDNRIWLLHGILLGEYGGLEQARSSAHMVYLTGGPEGPQRMGVGRKILVLWMPHLLVGAYLVLAWCAFLLKSA